MAAQSARTPSTPGLPIPPGTSLSVGTHLCVGPLGGLVKGLAGQDVVVVEHVVWKAAGTRVTVRLVGDRRCDDPTCVLTCDVDDLRFRVAVCDGEDRMIEVHTVVWHEEHGEPAYVLAYHSRWGYPLAVAVLLRNGQPVHGGQRFGEGFTPVNVPPPPPPPQPLVRPALLYSQDHCYKENLQAQLDIVRRAHAAEQQRRAHAGMRAPPIAPGAKCPPDARNCAPLPSWALKNTQARPSNFVIALLYAARLQDAASIGLLLDSRPWDALKALREALRTPPANSTAAWALDFAPALVEIEKSRGRRKFWAKEWKLADKTTAGARVPCRAGAACAPLAGWRRVRALRLPGGDSRSGRKPRGGVGVS